MLQIIQRKWAVPFCKRYFASADQPEWWTYLLPVAYMDCYSPAKPSLFGTEHRHTLLTDLRPPEEEIFRHFSKDVRSQIRRCEEQQLFQTNFQTALTDFANLYNAFAPSRGLSAFTPADAVAIGAENYLLCSADWQGKPAVCHFYLLDRTSRTANLLISVSIQFRHSDPDWRRALSFANRCLHWQGMRHLKAQGFHTYDWGGYVPDTDDPALKGINRFKRGFNGTLTPIYNHYSPAYGLAERARHGLRLFRRGKLKAWGSWCRERDSNSHGVTTGGF